MSDDLEDNFSFKSPDDEPPAWIWLSEALLISFVDIVGVIGFSLTLPAFGFMLC